MTPVNAAFLDHVREYTFVPSTGTFTHGSTTLRVKVHPTHKWWTFTNAAGMTMTQSTRDDLAGSTVIRADGSFFTSAGLLRVLAIDGAEAVSQPFPTAPGHARRPRRHGMNPARRGT